MSGSRFDQILSAVPASMSNPHIAMRASVPSTVWWRRGRQCCGAVGAAGVIRLASVLWLLAASGAGMSDSSACWAADSDAVAHSDTTSDVGAVSAPTVASMKQKQEQLAKRRHAVEQMVASDPSHAPAAGEKNAIRMELEVLKYYELICAQHAEELDRASDLKDELTQWQTRLHQFRLTGPEEAKPYSILLADDIQDELDAESTRLQTLTLELSVAKDTQQTTLRLHEEAEKKRRQTREAMEAERDVAKRQQYAKRLELEQLKCQMFSDMILLRRTEIANKEVDHQICETHVTYLREKAGAVAGNTVFTSEHLQGVLAELDKFETELRAQLPVLQSRLQELETQEFDAAKGQQQEQSSDEQLQAEMKNGWQLSKRNYQVQMKMIQQRLRDLVLARLGWNIRYKIFNALATREQLAKWGDDVRMYVQRVAASRHLLEEESKSLMVDLGRRETQLRIMRRTNTAAAKWIEYQIASMHELSQAYATNLVQVEAVERMLSKMVSALDKDLKPDHARDWFRMLGGNLQAAWNYEITSVDDRPITVRKVVAGIVLMLLGFYVSRRLSRLIGRRMLPRIGFDNGAATAVQSISFYLLITCFGFVSLELINIPITVFTFLGGAVAIGVGFGSQNILNNFISGLILLAERPIRVGDLVDIGGTCGNVEKIGARSTRIKTGSNLEIIVPNSRLLEDSVTNWTLSDARMRSVVKVGVAYGASTEDVLRLLKQAVGECEHALHEPAPIVLLSDFGDNALMFEVHFWIYVRTMMQARQIESDLRYAIERLLRRANITIAFPQRDLHLDTLKPLEVNIRQLGQLAVDDEPTPHRRHAA